MTDIPSPETSAPRTPFHITLWDWISSPVSFVYLSILWCLDLAVGSILAYQRDPQFWMKMDSYPFNAWLEQVAPQQWPGSFWVYGLVALTWLVIASLALCTLNWFFRKRKHSRGLAEVAIHLGFLLVFVGFVLGSGWGTRVQNIQLEQGQSHEVSELGLKLQLDGVDIIRDDEGNELDAVSRVTLFGPGGGEVASGTAKRNNPLIHGYTVVYPQGSGSRIIGATLQAGALGELTLGPSGYVALPDGRAVTLRGALPEGRQWGQWVGPGLFLQLLDREGKTVASGFVGETEGSRTATLGTLSLTLVTLNRQVQAVFNVHRDPGVQWVLAGAVILMFGTLWALVGYLRRPATEA